MGRTAIIVVFVMLVVVGGIFVSLSQKQTQAIDSIIQENYSKQARHLANTYAHTMVGRLRRHLDENATIDGLAAINMPKGIILDIPNASVNTSVNDKNYVDNIFSNGNITQNLHPLQDGEFSITSTGRVESPEGIIYEAITQIVYTTGDNGDLIDNVEQYLRIGNNLARTTSGPGHSENFNTSAFHGAMQQTFTDIEYFEGENVFQTNSYIAVGADGVLNNLPQPITIKSGDKIFIANPFKSENVNNNVSFYAKSDFFLKDDIVNHGTMNIYVEGNLIVDRKVDFINNAGTLNLFVGGDIVIKHHNNEKQAGRFVHNGGIVNIYSTKNLNKERMPSTVNYIVNANTDSLPLALNSIANLSSNKSNPRVKLWEEKPINVYR